MKDKKTHINISVDEETLSLLNHLATENKLSLTQVAQQLLEEAIEQREDDALAKLAEKRLRESHEVTSHEEIVKIIKERDQEPLETIPDDEAWR